MKKRGILNDRLNWVLARLGHGDRIVIADCGLPIPNGPLRIDISLVPGVPSFRDVVQAIAQEIEIQRLFVAKEMKHHNHEHLTFLQQIFPGVPVEEVSHERLKGLVREAKAVIRTGEATPYANVILEAGVIF
ncbi:D-ribose pyranase [Candidatus Bipolaricaulota sp. J31]